MSSSIKGQEATVTLLQGGQEVDHDIVIRNPDMVRFDTTRHTHKWPGMEEAPILWATFVAWAACRRLDLTTAKWEDFRDTECLNVHMARPEEGQDVDPTRPGAAPDFA